MLNKKILILFFSFLLVGLLFLSSLSLLYFNIIMISLGLIFVLLIFYLKPEIGLYLMILSLPLINWSFTVRTFEFSFVEGLAILVLLAYGLHWLVRIINSKRSLKDLKWPLFKYFSIFFVILILSSLFSKYILFSGWYSLRWLGFMYLAYVMAPYNIIKDGLILKWSLICLSVSGILVATMGVASLFYQDWYNTFFRVQPLAIFGIYPIGSNHNLIAEFLVITTWFILSLKYWFKAARQRRLIDILFIFLLLVTVGTFSRTGWIVLGLEIIFYIVLKDFYIKNKKFDFKKYLAIGAIALMISWPFVGRMLTLQAGNASSTQNRVLLTQIAWRAFLTQPILGHGPGMFVSLVENNIRFGAKYGDPLDSHGVGQKVLAETGALGVLSFLAFVGFLFEKIFTGFKKYKKEYELLLPLLIGSIGGFIYQFFNTSYYKGKLWVPLAIALAAVKLLDKKYERERLK